MSDAEVKDLDIENEDVKCTGIFPIRMIGRETISPIPDNDDGDKMWTDFSEVFGDIIRIQMYAESPIKCLGRRTYREDWMRRVQSNDFGKMMMPEVRYLISGKLMNLTFTAMVDTMRIERYPFTKFFQVRIPFPPGVHSDLNRVNDNSGYGYFYLNKGQNPVRAQWSINKHDYDDDLIMSCLEPPGMEKFHILGGVLIRILQPGDDVMNDLK